MRFIEKTKNNVEDILSKGMGFLIVAIILGLLLLPTLGNKGLIKVLNALDMKGIAEFFNTTDSKDDNETNNKSESEAKSSNAVNPQLEKNITKNNNEASVSDNSLNTPFEILFKSKNISKSIFESKNIYELKWITGKKEILDNMVEKVFSKEFPKSKVYFDEFQQKDFIRLTDGDSVSISKLKEIEAESSKTVQKLCDENIKQIGYHETKEPFLVVRNEYVEGSIRDIKEYCDNGENIKAENLAKDLVNFILEESYSGPTENSYSDYFVHYIIENKELFLDKLNVVRIFTLDGKTNIERNYI